MVTDHVRRVRLDLWLEKEIVDRTIQVVEPPSWPVVYKVEISQPMGPDLQPSSGIPTGKDQHAVVGPTAARAQAAMFRSWRFNNDQILSMPIRAWPEQANRA